jgi:ABC-2 type transport system permease protein
MRKVLVIAGREYQAAVRTKSFIISVLILPIMMCGSIVVQLLLKDHVDVTEKRFALVDRSPGEKLANVLEAAVKQRNEVGIFDPKTKKQILPRFVIERVSPQLPFAPQRFDLSEQVRKQELFGFLEIGADVLQAGPAAGSAPGSSEFSGRRGLDSLAHTQTLPDAVVLRYQSNSPTYDDFYHWAEHTLNQAIWQSRCEASGVSKEKLASIVQPVPLVVKGLSRRNPTTGEIEEGKDENQIASILMPGGLMILMFMLILVGATPLMQGVVEEKMQRIAEVLLGSVRPFDLMLGKLLGMVGVSVTLSVIYLGGTYWAAYRYDLIQYLPPTVLAWFLVYQVLAVLMYGSLFIAIGAACTDMRETQSMVWPVMLLVTVPMFIWINVVREPNSPFSTGVSFFPFATPMLMMIRLAVPPGIAWWQPLLGIVVVLATTTVCVWVGGRIFRLGILLQGKGAHIGDLVKWVVRG